MSRHDQGSGYTFEIRPHLAGENTPCDHCATVPEGRVRLVDIIEEDSWRTVVSVRLCTTCRRQLRAQLHNFDRGYIGVIPGMARRKRSVSEARGFVVGARRIA